MPISFLKPSCCNRHSILDFGLARSAEFVPFELCGSFVQFKKAAEFLRGETLRYPLVLSDYLGLFAGDYFGALTFTLYTLPFTV
jgi:hypothetical protein